ncbi:hypothetical protein A1D22_11350 [Pasteurellaceae bacterium LFhippo2]|nr:hypothetical protein [Pasteurellaceae bacterium LFhippo2]
MLFALSLPKLLNAILPVSLPQAGESWENFAKIRMLNSLPFMGERQLKITFSNFKQREGKSRERATAERGLISSKRTRA